MPSRVRIALDLSCVFEHPRTGVGYAAWHQIRALIARRPALDLRLFATRARGVPARMEGFEGGFSRTCVLPWARRLKVSLWPACDWPPIEWFTGRVDIAHNLFHQLPAARHAVRMVTVHDLSFFRRPETHTEETIRVQTRLLHHIARRADAIIAVSESCKADLVDLLQVNAARIYVVPGGVCLDEFTQAEDPEATAALRARLGLEGPYFIHLGTMEPRKNLLRLMDAYAHLRARRRDCPKLLLAGKTGWKSEPILARVGEPGVVHAGYLARAEAIALLRRAEACVYPSLYEGFGLSVLEAMAAGTPVITSNISSLPEVAGDTARYIDPESTESIEEALEDVLEHPDAARARAVAGLSRAQTLTWDASAARLEQVYQECMRGRD